MRSIDLSPLDSAVRLAGILHVFPRGEGLGLGRIREEAVTQIIDPVLLWTASCPSGGRIEFTSNTTAVEVDLQLTRLAFGDDPAPDAGVDLVVDGTLTAGRRATEGHTLFGEDDLDDLPDGLHPNADGYARMGERFHAAAFTPGGVFAG